MFGIALALILGAALAAVARLLAPRDRIISLLLVGGYVLRIGLQFFVRETALFSHQAGGDCELYELYATAIAHTWEYSGIHFISAAEFPDIGATSLPPNLFAAVIYLNSGPTRVGCTAIVAFLAGLSCLNIYHLAIDRGAEMFEARKTVSLLYFGPAFLMYTSDMFKDGLVVALAIGALASGIRLTRKFSIVHAVIGILSIYALWYVRFYLVFATTAPLLVGLVGLGAKSPTRLVLASLTMVVIAIFLTGYTDIIQRTGAHASATFEVGTSQAVLQSNATGGSGVVFDDGGSPFGDFGSKLAYTLFSPFPWASGSLGFQIGKFDALLWYYLLYRAVRAAVKIWRTDAAYVLMILTFVVPSTIMYASAMANVGLVVRERLIVVAATVLLSMRWQQRAPETSQPPATAHDVDSVRGVLRS